MISVLSLFLLVVFVYRFGLYVPLPLSGEIGSFGGEALGFTGILNLSALSSSSVLSLGIAPYITASIVTQVFSLIAFPDYFKDARVRSVFTYCMLLFFSFFQSVLLLQFFYDFAWDLLYFISLLSLFTGAVIVFWLSKILNLSRLMNGASFFVMLNLVESHGRAVFARLLDVKFGYQLSEIGFAVVFFACMFAFVIFFETSVRKVPFFVANMPRTASGREGQFFNLKLNSSGVMPVIFSSAIVSLVVYLLAYWGYESNLIILLLNIVAVSFFIFFYSGYVVKTEEVASSLKKGCFLIPGVRPGEHTKNFLDNILFFLNLMSCFYISSLLAVTSFTSFSIFSGVSVIIVVSVSLDILRRFLVNYTHVRYKKYNVARGIGW